jgi:hypothetical protein
MANKVNTAVRVRNRGQSAVTGSVATSEEITRFAEFTRLTAGFEN